MSRMCFPLDLLFPQKCPFCQKILNDPESPVCPACQPTLPWLTGQAAHRKPEFVTLCVSPLAYQGAVPKAIHRYKFKHVRACARPFGLLVTQCIQDHLLGQFDLITWAPISKKRLQERGYDQAEKLAREAGNRLDIPVLATLRKVRHTSPQSDLTSKAARKANALNAYAVLPGADLAGKRVLLIDDVVTSSSTLSECARMLRMSGAAQVVAATLAQAGKQEEN